MTRLALLLTLILAASSPRPAHDYPTPNGTPDRGRAGASNPLPVADDGLTGSVPTYTLTRQGGPNPATAEPSPGTQTSPIRAPIRGIASWYRATGMIAAAGPALRVGDWRGSTVTVCAERCIRVRLTDYCACVVDGRERLIDLSDDAVRALGLRLSTGLYRVTVAW